MDLEVYSQSINRGVVKMPSQNFPGIVIQGETLSGLLALAQAAYAKALETSDTELVNTALELRDSLQKLLAHYESTLNRHNIPLPYSTAK